MPTTPAAKSAFRRALIVVLVALVRAGIAIGEDVLECEPFSASSTMLDDDDGLVDFACRRAPNAATDPASISTDRSDACR